MLISWRWRGSGTSAIDANEEWDGHSSLNARWRMEFGDRNFDDDIRLDEDICIVLLLVNSK